MNTNQNALKRDGLLKALERSATDKDDEGPRNILLAGPWGAGKTTLLERLGREIKDSAESSLHVFAFSPWSSAADGDPAKGFLRALHGELTAAWKLLKGNADSKGRITGWLKVAEDLLKQDDVRTALEWIPGGKTLAIGGGALAGLMRMLLGTQPQAGIEGLREEIRQLLKDVLEAHKKKRILLLVDDLDRALPEDAIAILDGLYHLFLPHVDGVERNAAAKDGKESEIAWPLTSVWAVNTAVLEEYLYREYRDLPSFDPNAYIEKLFSQRINVPPLFYVSGKDGDGNEAYGLWADELEKHNGKLPGIDVEALSRALAEGVNYAILGNLRLHARLRRDCLRLWTDPNRTLPLSEPADYVRSARLLTLVDAFAVFRERIAPYNGMWPVFLNQLNRRWAERAVDWIANPLHRHTDSPDLATLLTDLGVIRYDRQKDRYDLIPAGRAKLQSDLNGLWICGI